MTREKVINYIDSLIQQAHESDRFFTERNRLYVENQQLKNKWDELKKCIEQWIVYHDACDNDYKERNVLEDVLKKMEEL